MKGVSRSHVYFQHLDVIRFFAAFMIVILHAYEAWRGWFGEIGILSGGTYTELTASGQLIDQFIKNLGIGVDVFFLISGFLITYILLEEKKQYGRIAIGKFMMRRTLRIWPLYFLLIAIAPMLVNWVDAEHPNYLANAFFVGNFDTMSNQTWSYPFAHFWSICIEEHFYLVWPFVISFIPIKRLPIVFVSIILFSISYRIYAYSYADAPWYSLFLHTFARIDVLVIGALGAWFYSRKKFTVFVPKTLRYMIILFLICYLCIDSYVLWDSVFAAGFKKLVYVSLIAILLLDFNFNDRFKHLLKPRSKIHYLGKVSYGIYMYSNLLLIIIIKKIMLTNESSNIWVFGSLVLVLSLVIPIISYELIEKRFLGLNKYFRVIQTER
jgi:peptidoglycan/LPS O-acetylase OafA/YrhL